MIADRGEVESEQIHCVDGRLVEVQRGYQGARPYEVACSDGDRIGMAGAQRLRRSREVGNTAGGDPHLRFIRRSRFDPVLGRLEIAMEVVDRENLHLDRSGGHGRRHGGRPIGGAPGEQESDGRERSE